MKTDKPTQLVNQEERISFKIDYFYKKFVSNNRFIESLGEKKKEQTISFQLYRKIIKTFFLIYFNEVFFSTKPLYFMLGGVLERVRITPFRALNNHLIKSTVSVIWYLRPMNTMSACSIRLMNGSTGAMPKLRNQWAEENDLGLLKSKPERKNEIKETKTKYLYNDKQSIFFRSNNSRC